MKKTQGVVFSYSRLHIDSYFDLWTWKQTMYDHCSAREFTNFSLRGAGGLALKLTDDIISLRGGEKGESDSSNYFFLSFIRTFISLLFFLSFSLQALLSSSVNSPLLFQAIKLMIFIYDINLFSTFLCWRFIEPKCCIRIIGVDSTRQRKKKVYV